MFFTKKIQMECCGECGIYFRPATDGYPLTEYCQQHRRPLLDAWILKQEVMAWAANSGYENVKKAYLEAQEATRKAYADRNQHFYAQMASQRNVWGNMAAQQADSAAARN